MKPHFLGLLSVSLSLSMLKKCEKAVGLRLFLSVYPAFCRK
jgi:hypothetical protein